MHKAVFAIVHGIAAAIVGVGAIAFVLAIGTVAFMLLRALM